MWFMSSFRKWLLGAAVGVMAALLMAPSTSWLVRNQIGVSHGAGGVDTSLAPSGDAITAAASSPNDLQIQIAAVFKTALPSQERTLKLRQLKERFPNEPAVYATVLRSDCQGEMNGTKRPEQDRLSGEDINLQTPAPRPPSDEAVAAFLTDAAEGERVDPDNAYFPFLRSVALFAAYRDEEALEAVSRAASRPRWEEYIQEEALGQVRLSESMYGRRPAVVKTALYAAIVFPQYAALRSSARMVTYNAIQIEMQGDIERGIRLRTDLMRLGDLMRAEGKSLISALVGRAITAIAILRPGGIIYPKTENGKRLTSERAIQTKREIYDAYLRKHNHAEDAEWVGRVLDTGRDLQPVISVAMHESGFAGRPFYRLMGYWVANLTLLGSISWLLIIGGAAALLGRSRAMREGRTLTTAVKVGGAVGLLLGIAFIALVGSIPAGVMLGAAVAALAALNARSRSGGRFRFLEVLASVGVTFVVILSAVALFTWQTTGVREMVGVWALIGTGIGRAEGNLLAAMVLAVPIFLALLIGGVSLMNRVPLSVGLVRGFRGLALPTACVLALVYAGTILGTLSHEKPVDEGCRATIEHEGKYLFRLAGKEWPGVTLPSDARSAEKPQ